jgi:hypothetical protein
MVYALQKFRQYRLGSHINMYTDHSVLRYLVNKPVLGRRICIWILLFQEYDFEVIVKPWKFNSGPDHLSCILTREDAGNLDDNLTDAYLFAFQVVDDYFTDRVQFLSTRVAPQEFKVAQNKHLVVKVSYYQLIVGNLYKLGTNGIMRRFILEHER